MDLKKFSFGLKKKEKVQDAGPEIGVEEAARMVDAFDAENSEKGNFSLGYQTARDKFIEAYKSNEDPAKIISLLVSLAESIEVRADGTFNPSERDDIKGFDALIKIENPILFEKYSEYQHQLALQLTPEEKVAFQENYEKDGNPKKAKIINMGTPAFLKKVAVLTAFGLFSVGTALADNPSSTEDPLIAKVQEITKNPNSASKDELNKLFVSLSDKITNLGKEIHRLDEESMDPKNVAEKSNLIAKARELRKEQQAAFAARNQIDHLLVVIK